MLQFSIPATPTERVVARLASEGWVKCPGLGFEALCQHHLPDLRAFVLEQLQHQDNWLCEVDLQLATLVFSVAADEFQFHPHLEAVLRQLESERVIEIQEFEKTTRRQEKPERIILLKAAYVA
ncbi:hypothetical protein IFO70_26125 [Phormidium tenue FACHB-886]|nr:hypothetical protein [Phormidium tenue FACHB-886]